LASEPLRGGAGLRRLLRCRASSASHGARHVAIIMDGNGRWAKKRFLPRAVGHKAGVEAVRKMVAPRGNWGWSA
jgi:undecaprenyl diphosphate synthase